MQRPCGSFSETYQNDMALIRTRWEWTAFAALIGLLAVFPLIAPIAWIRFGTITAITIIAVVGLQLLMGLCGQVSVGQSAFMGIGAYCSAVAAATFNLPFPLPVLVGAIGAAVTGILFGLPAARIKGFYLALTTLAAQFVFQFTVVRLPPQWFGASSGVAVPRPRIFGHAIHTPMDFYYLVVPIAVLLTAVAVFIQRHRIGRALVAIRDNDLAAQVTGINVTYYKVLAFALASFYAGAAGSLLAYENGLAHFEQFTLLESIWFLGMLIVGGLGTVLGAVLGTIALRLVQEVLSIVGPPLGLLLPGARYDLVFPLINVAMGVLILVFLMFQPRGIAHLYRQVERYVRLWPFPY